MSLEPKKPIEELLEAFVRARRAQFGADPKMPNPTRARLHQEIARLGRADEGARPAPSFRILWPRLVAGTAFALLLVSVSGVWWWRQHQSAGDETMKLAMQEPTAPASEAPEKIFEQGAATAGSAPQSLADSNSAASRPAKEANETDALRKFTEGTITPTTTVPPTEDTISSAGKTDQPLLAAKEPSMAAVPAREALAQSRQITNFRQQSSQSAANQALRGKLKQPLNILNDFQVEQIDHEIRLVDADGSTYSGKLEPLAQNDARSVFNQKQSYAAPAARAVEGSEDKKQSVNAEFYFRASGYNTSLKKSLVFEGNYIASSLVQKKIPGVKKEAPARSEEIPARIMGTAKISGESPLQIDAIAVAK